MWQAVDASDVEERWFKVKDERLTVVDRGNMAKTALQTEHMVRAQAFAAALVTENRAGTGLGIPRWDEDTKKGQDRTGTSAFLKWMLNDCMIEEKLRTDEFEVSAQDLRVPISCLARK